MKNSFLILALLLLSFTISSQVVDSEFQNPNKFQDNYKPADMKNPNFNYEIFSICKNSKSKNLKQTSSKTVKQAMDSSYIYYEGSTSPESSSVFLYDENNNNTETHYYYADDVSMELEIGDKNTLVFNEQNLVSTNTSYNWDDITGWKEDVKYEYEYDANWNMTIQTAYDWLEEWIPMYKYENTYNENNEQILYIYYIWDSETEEWIFSSKEEYGYNEQGLFIFYTSAYYDVDNSIWINSYKYEYTYNENNLMETRTVFGWNSVTEEWIPDQREEFSYDANNNHILTISGYWDNILEDFDTSYKYEFEYDECNQNILSVFYQWSEYKASWIAISKYEYTYNGHGDMLTSKYFNWDDDLSNWQIDSQDEYTYDEFWNEVLYIYSYWDYDLSYMVLSHKTIKEYNSIYPYSDLIIAYEYLNDFEAYSYMLLNAVNYNWNIENSEWVESSKFEFFYSEQNVNAINNLPDDFLQIYPNPANDIINIDLNNLSENMIFELFDIQGRKVLSAYLDNNKEISVKHLNSGVFFYKIADNSVILNGKLIIE